jgi:Flp pilus assembly protein TadG
MTTSRNVRLNERGAVLVHVAVVLVGLIAFTAFAYDYGVMFVSRREAQNAADAGALAGAISLSFSNPGDQNVARLSAVEAARSNAVWGQTPDILTTDVTFPACPPGAPGEPDTCVRANVFRTNYNRGAGSPLPTFFAQLVGVNEQGVRGTATAQLLTGMGTADCVKPVAIPDKWIEVTTPGGWTNTSTFEHYDQTGGPTTDPPVLTPHDDYDPAQGFDEVVDYGVEVILKEGNPNDAIDPGFYYPIQLEGPGGATYEDLWATCSGHAVIPGDPITAEPGNKVGPTKHGVQVLLDADHPEDLWDPLANGGRGGPPASSCMYSATCPGGNARSPRLVAIPVFDTLQYDHDRASEPGGGRTVSVIIVRVLGMWLDRMVGNDVHGYIMHYPTTSLTGGGGPGAFARTVILVR